MTSQGYNDDLLLLSLGTTPHTKLEVF